MEVEQACQHFFYSYLSLLDNLCQNALNLTHNEHINIQDNWPMGTYCQWMISAKDEAGSYITLEFNYIKVR